MITAFLNQKGGVGKTTLSTSFTTALAQDGHKVLLIDADPQRGALTWVQHREEPPLFPVVGLPTDKLHREMNAHVANYDHLVIDAPPQVSRHCQLICPDGIPGQGRGGLTSLLPLGSQGWSRNFLPDLESGS